MTWLLRWTLNGDFSLILLQLVKEQLTHDVGHWALLQGMKRQFSLAKVTWLGLLDRKHSLSSCCFFSGQMWRQGFILGKIFHCWPHLVGWLDGLEAFLLLTDHFHRRPGATLTLPATHHPNVKMFIIKPLVFDLCSFYYHLLLPNHWSLTSGWSGVAERPRCGLETSGGKIWSVFQKKLNLIWSPRKVNDIWLKVVTAYNGKSLEVEDENGDRVTITVKDAKNEQADLPPLRWTWTSFKQLILLSW